MIVASSITHSKSGSCKASNTRSQTPFLAHRLNRWKVLFQSPNRSGKSRHGAPVRTIHNTASRNNRLSFAGCPGSPARPGNRPLDPHPLLVRQLKPPHHNPHP